MVYTPNREIETLQRLKIEMERRLTAIDEEQKTLEKETKIIKQKVAIQELQKAVRKRRDELASLRLKRAELENKTK